MGFMRYTGPIALGLLMLLPVSASAATSFEVSGWLPYWSVASDTADVMPHLDELSQINPFVYSVNASGAIVDNGTMASSSWVSLLAAAKAQKVRVVPTVMWSNASAETAILGSATKRVALENAIAKLVKSGKYDGIDIDFENKPAALKDNFSTFLKGLYARMGTKLVTCDIEARTPLDAAYYGTDVPATAGQYANDYAQINKYCDRVNIMAYDQQGVDGLLAAEAASSSKLYAPVADPAWVESVVALAEKTINPKKIVIGVPTYGYEYDVTVYSGSQYIYDILWTFNPRYATQLATQYGITPERNAAGELDFSYTPNANTTASSSPVALTPNSAYLAATAASLYATSYNSHLSFRYVDWPDAQSLQDKIDLAKELGVRGIAIFEFNGGEDQNIWNVLQGVKK